MSIIAIGILVLVAILTFFDALKGELISSFSGMGSNTFTIQNFELSFSGGPHGRKMRAFRPVSFHQAQKFKQVYTYPATVSLSMVATGTARVRYRSKETESNVRVVGVDENYFRTSGYQLAAGRGFSAGEASAGGRVAIIGSDVVEKVFGAHIDPVGKYLHIGDARYRVAGVLKSKGNRLGASADNQCLVTVQNARQYFGTGENSCKITVAVGKVTELEKAISEATGAFRKIRKVPPGEENTFEIVKSDRMAKIIVEQTAGISAIATLVGIITLLGAVVGLMNIMLVSVTERTREIGIRKALGASSGTIRQQFLLEAIMISNLGGAAGIILGVALGNVIAYTSNFDFVIPWFWMVMSVIICVVVGMISGYYPAGKAAELDPVDALRHE